MSLSPFCSESVYSLYWKYWNLKTRSFMFAIHWRHSGLRSGNEYETIEENLGYHFMIFTSICNMACKIFCWNPVIFIKWSKNIGTCTWQVFLSCKCVLVGWFFKLWTFILGMSSGSYLESLHLLLKRIQPTWRPERCVSAKSRKSEPLHTQWT